MASSRRWRILGRGAAVLALVAFLYLVLRWFEQRNVYFPTAGLEATGRELGRPVEDVWFATSDGVRLNGWFYPASADSPRRHLVFLLAHGNGGNISHRLDYYDVLLGLGAAVFVFDYRGYGRSTGRPGEEGTYLDAQAAHRWLRERGFAATNVIAVGESLGGGVVSELALREPLGALVLQSTFTSIPDIGKELFPWLPVGLIATIRYDTINKLPRLRVPVLILHSRADRMIGFHHAERNLAAANEPKTLWEITGDHNEPLAADRARFGEGLDRLLRNFPTLSPPGLPTAPSR
jgi:hypothetical protein